MGILEVNHIKKVYKTKIGGTEVEALKDIHFSVESGVNDATYGIEKRGETTFITSSGISDWEIKFKTGCKSEYSVIDISDT